MKTYLRLLGYLRPYRGQAVLGLLCMGVATPLSLAHPWIWRYLVDEVVLAKRPERLAGAAAVMLGTYVLGTALDALRENLLERVALAFVRDLRNEVHRKLQSQSVGYLQQHRSGDLIARVVGDVDLLQSVALRITQSVVANVYAFLVIGTCIVLLNPLLAAIVVPPVAIVWVLVRRFNERIRELYRTTRGRLGHVSARLQELLAGTMIVKAFAQEEQEARRFRRLTGEHWEAEEQALNARSLFYPSLRLLGHLTTTVSIAAGAWLILQGRFTLGGLVAFRAYAAELLEPVYGLAQINDLFQRGSAAAARVFEVLDAPVEVTDAPDAVELPNLAGRIAFEGVQFAYGARPVLRGIDLDVPPGAVVAIVGSSGGGKSTLVNLVSRFWDPTAGRVRIDGRDLREASLRSLRRQIGMVLQEPFLFTGTILENVRYARPEATLEDARAAAEAANALRFIEEELPEGWNTEVGERGVRLSGGQRQRLCIARAFLADPRILILDEPTSAVEPESEWLIQQALQRLAENRTTLIVTHRLSMARWADRIVVLDDGRIAEAGTHSELLQAGGLYAGMYSLQQREASPVQPAARSLCGGIVAS